MKNVLKPERSRIFAFLVPSSQSYVSDIRSVVNTSAKILFYDIKYTSYYPVYVLKQLAETHLVTSPSLQADSSYKLF